jgi:hypothetical protein
LIGKGSNTVFSDHFSGSIRYDFSTSSTQGQ